MDPILQDHLNNGKRNAKMVSWKIQNDIIASIAEFLRERIREQINSTKCYAVIADEVTDRHANKEILLVCLRYVYFCNDQVTIRETFLDSVHVEGRPTGKTIGNYILTVLKKHGIDINLCRAQAYDGASAMSSDRVGASAVLKEQQPNAEYTHCRSHCLNLSISFACKNQSITNFMSTLTSASNFFAYSAKRQQYFELFIDYYKNQLEVSTNRKKLIGLSKTRWVERHKAYDNYYLLHRCLVATFESINNYNRYSEFYNFLEEKFNEPWTWDSDTKSLSQGLYKACSSFQHLISFSILFNGLEPVKPLATKLQKRNADIYVAYHMIDEVIDQLRSYRDNIDDEFSEWYNFAVSMSEKIGVGPSMPRIAPCWSRYRNNVENDGPLDYYKRAIAIPVMDALTNDLIERMKDRNHVELFAILPSVLANDESIDLGDRATSLFKKIGGDLVDNEIALLGEMKRWKNLCHLKFKKKKKMTTESPPERSKDKRRRDLSKDKERVDGKIAFDISGPPDGFIDRKYHFQVFIMHEIAKQSLSRFLSIYIRGRVALGLGGAIF